MSTINPLLIEHKEHFLYLHKGNRKKSLSFTVDTLMMIGKKSTKSHYEWQRNVSVQ